MQIFKESAHVVKITPENRTAKQLVDDNGPFFPEGMADVVKMLTLQTRWQKRIDEQIVDVNVSMSLTQEGIAEMVKVIQ